MGVADLAETLLGLMLVYLLMSIFCSAASESLARYFGRRGRFLREGMRNLVDDDWIFPRLIHHPMLSSYFRDLPGKPAYPSYIPPGTFARALLDTLSIRGELLGLGNGEAAVEANAMNIDGLRAAAKTCRDHGSAVGRAVVPLLESATGGVEDALDNIESWFDGAMERVGGWYKARAQRTLFLVGFAVAVLANVDTLEILTTLAGNAAARTAVADAARNAPDPADVPEGSALSRLRALETAGLPIGFSCLSDREAEFETIAERCLENAASRASGGWALKLVGWLLTALAVRQGAPFWFDLLNRLVNVRGSGSKPQRK